MHWKAPARALFFYYILQFYEQVLAVVPITLCLVITIGIYFQRTVNSPGTLAGGLISAMVGLVLFVDGLRVAIMPLGSLLGQQLPEQFKVRYILVVACAIGILVTYAEPAIASLRPLANLVKRCDTPYLFFVLNDMSEILVLSIGLGVGVAAMIGVLRFLRNWSLKPLIALGLSPTIACACYMKWGNPELSPLIGLAWDCGAVTTGPVTVPILLSLGIGVMKGSAARRDARDVLEQQAGKNKGKALEGFGIITLASTFPILAVELMSIFISLRYSSEDIRTDFGKIDCSQLNGTETGLEVKETDAQLVLSAFTFAIRSILPLNVFLIIMIVLVLWKPLPKISFEVQPPAGLLPDLNNHSDKLYSFFKCLDDNNSETITKEQFFHAVDCLEIGIEEHEKEDLFTSIDLDDDGEISYAEFRNLECFRDADKNTHEEISSKIKKRINEFRTQQRRECKQERRERIANAVGMLGRTSSNPHGRITRRQESVLVVDDEEEEEGEKEVKLSLWQKVRAQSSLLLGILESQMGMTLFNIGLSFGFTALGDQSGVLLPSAFLETSSFPGSPYYAKGPGIAIVMVTIFVLGFLATRAEPALRVMGKTVELLSGGQFGANMLVYTVCVGVGCGMVAGSSKILFGVNIIYMILGKYAAASLLTIFASEDFTNIAWDSAGVTTGPVTVPFVLSIGIGFSKATSAQEGFGILTCASVAPIITVLLTDRLRTMYGQAVKAYVQRRLSQMRSVGVQCEPEEGKELLEDGKRNGGEEAEKEWRKLVDSSTQFDMEDLDEVDVEDVWVIEAAC